MGYLVQNGYGYGPAASLHQQQLYYNQNVSGYGRTAGKGGHPIQQIQKGGQRGIYQKSQGYQLKVGGVVVGSWANGSNRPGVQGGHRVNRTGMVRINMIINVICYILMIVFFDSHYVYQFIETEQQITVCVQHRTIIQ